MSERWVLDRGYPFIDPISDERRRAKWEEVNARPDADVKGSLEDGFSYVVAGSRGLLRATIRPARDTDRCSECEQ